MSVFEPVAWELGQNHFDIIKRQVSSGDCITREDQRVIQDIIDSLESGINKLCKNDELEKLLKVAQSGETSKIKPTKVNLSLQRNDEVYLIDIKTAKPNKGGFKEFKRTLLTWVALMLITIQMQNSHLDCYPL